MQTYVEGYYFDGQTATRHQATVHLTPSGLQIRIEGDNLLWWPYEEIRHSPHSYSEGQVGLERGKDISELLLVPGPLFFQGLKAIAPETGKKFNDPTRRKNWLMVTLVSVLGVAGITTILYFQGIPAMASLMASHVPVSWEEHLGQAVVRHLAPPEKRCLDPTGGEIIHKIVNQLTASYSGNPYTFRVIVVNDPIVNAFAAPGGYIIIFCGLIKQTKTAEELAGVLAHEMQHTLHRHGTRAILQHASTKLLLSAMVGDSRGAMTYGLEGARILGMLRYSRQNEEEADRDGIRMAAASGIDPTGLVTFFEGIKKKESFRLPAYLSTHPDLEERIDRLKRLAAESPGRLTKLLPDYNWQDLQGICKKHSLP
jgi:predicted Zn-dependent protease